MTAPSNIVPPNGSGEAPLIGIVIPARDEEDFILSTLDSLTFQRVPGGPRIEPSSYEIVVVDSSSDSTAQKVLEFAACQPVKITLLREEEASMVTPRVSGMRYFLDSDQPPKYLVSADADTTFPPAWLSTAATALDRGAELVSSAGYMSPVLWERCPRLTERYLEDVGPIFFDPITVKGLGLGEETYRFTEQVFLDFGRPVSDAGFAITTDCYVALGGFRQDYWGEDESSPLAAVGWPLMYRAELSARHISYMRTPFWSTSPRRLISEPEELFTTKAYLGEIAAFRAVSDDKYAWLDHFADRLDLRPLQEYCLKYYVLQRCITRPQLVRRNERYFGGLADEIAQTIFGWHAATSSPTPGAILNFASELCERFADRLFESLPRSASPPLQKEDSGTPAHNGAIPRPGQGAASGTMANPTSGFAPPVVPG